MRYIKRLLGLPLFMGLLGVGMIYAFFVKSYLWVKFGGEVVNYSEKLNRKTITDVFLEVQQRKSQGNAVQAARDHAMAK
jgi:hypothetical protein